MCALIVATEPAGRAARPAVLPTVLGLALALAGPFLFQRLVAPRVLEPRLGPLAYVLVGQGVLWLLAGTVIAVAGVACLAAGAAGLGRLPGDFAFGGERVRVYVPLASCIVISVVATTLVNLLFRR